MSRKILCEQCGVLTPMHPEDVLNGFQRRRVEIRAKKPADHHVDFYTGESLASLAHTERRDLPSLMCDRCGKVIHNGDPAVAVTMWQGEEPENWEKDYQ